MPTRDIPRDDASNGDDRPDGASASPADRNTAPGSTKASNGEAMPVGELDASRPDDVVPHSRRAAEPTGVTRVEDSPTTR